MTTIYSAFRAALVALSLVFVAACGGGGDDQDSIPAPTASCQMKRNGVAIWGEVRPWSVLEKKTVPFGYAFGYATPSANGGIFFSPQFVVHHMESGSAIVELVPPPAGPHPPYVPAKLRIVVDANEGYRYGMVWSCMVEELVIGDVILIRSSGEETVPAQVHVEAYWPVAELPSQWFAPGYEYFSVDGDSVSLDLR
jgi:hypothetical protein